jgi:hypothetical protein
MVHRIPQRSQSMYIPGIRMDSGAGQDESDDSFLAALCSVGQNSPAFTVGDESRCVSSCQKLADKALMATSSSETDC